MRNKDHLARKEFSEIERELKDISKTAGRFPLIIDTGAFIDLQRRSEQGIHLCGRGCGKGIVEFLDKIEEYSLPIVTDQTMIEIEKHAKIKRNSNTYELSPCVLGKATIYNSFMEEYESLLVPLERETNGYEGWLYAKTIVLPFLDSLNRDVVSETDLEILKKGYVYSTTKSTTKEVPLGEIPKAVGVLTSDGGHVGTGTCAISQLLPNLKLINTRN